MGLDYATGGTMTVAGKKLVVIEKDDQGKPDVGKSLLAAGLWRRQGRHRGRPDVVGRGAGACCRWPRNTRRSCWSSRRSPTRSPATSGTTTSSAPAATARRTRSRTRWRSTRQASSIATLAQDYAFGRDGVKAFKDALKKAKIVHEEYLPHDTTDFTAGGAAHHRRAEGQAGPQDHLDHLGRRRQPVQDRRPGPEALRHRDRHRRQHPAGDGRVQAVPRHGRRDLLLLRHPEEPGQRLAGRRTTTSSSRRRPTSSPPAA